MTEVDVVADLKERLRVIEDRAAGRPPALSPAEQDRQRRLAAAVEVPPGYQPAHVRDPFGRIVWVDGYDDDGYRVDPEDLRRGFTLQNIRALEEEQANALEKARIYSAKADDPELAARRPGWAEACRRTAQAAAVEAESCEVELVRCRAGLDQARAGRAGAAAGGSRW